MVKRMTRFSVHVYLILNVFICNGVTVVADIDCNFSMNFCNWEQDALDDFNWKRSKSDYWHTSPYSDHTAGLHNYIYVDPYNKFQGEIARLMSPMQSPGEYCLTFWYCMYGSDIGTFNVYIKMNDGNKTVIFSKNGMAVRDWWKSVLNIKAYDSFQIVLEGIIGDDILRYISIANIHIRSGSCSIDCDFDEDFCNWMQFDGDDFNWDRVKGRTPYRHPGPDADKKSGSGHYIYMETSNKNSHDTAILLSPLQDAGKYCLSFWYYMYGVDIDRLQIQIWNTNGSDRRTMFTLESAQGNKWFYKTISLYSMDVFQIAVEGRANYWWYWSSGVLAIDDVALFSCPDCKDLEIANAVTNSSNYEYGSVIKIQCDYGYSLDGDSEIVCQTMGNWSGTASCITHDCGDLEIPNGTLFTPNGTRIGHGGIQKCNTGFVLIGDPNIKCTANGWSNTTSYCNFIGSPNVNHVLITREVETNISPLIVVYVLVPVVFLLVAATFIVLYMRRRHLSCRKVLKTFKKAREVPCGDSVQGQSHSNQMYSDEDLQLDDEYATISGEQTDDKKLGTDTCDNYSTVDRSGIKKLGVLKEANQTKSTNVKKSACNIDENEYNTYNVLSNKALNKNLKGGEEHELDYDSACTRQMKNKAYNHDDYSQMGDLEMKYQHTQHCLPQPDIEKNTNYSHIDRVSSKEFPERLETDYSDYEEYQNPVVKEEKVLEKHTPKIKQLQDQALDYFNVTQTKEMYDSNASANQSNESENHDNFILVKT